MFSLNSITNRVATVAKGMMLLGTAVFGWGSVANAAEVAVKAGPLVEKVATVKLDATQQNLANVVAALAIIDPAWAKSLPKTKALKRKEEDEARKKAGSASATAEETQPAPQYVFFPGTSDTNCDAINLNQYMGTSTPSTIDEGVNPAQCEGEGRCCGKAYPAANVQYNPVTNRWEPTSETGVVYFSKSL